MSNEAYSIYSPTILKINQNYIMFYAAWKNKNYGNINLAISKDALNWKKKRKSIFKLENKIEIISEPFLIKNKNKIMIFFEYKKNKVWNISFKYLKNFFLNNI